MALSIPVKGLFGFGKNTQTAGTVITQLINPKRNLYTRLTSFKYTAAGTTHTITVMRPYGSTTLSSAALASQAVVNITADSGVTPPGVIAANDFLVIEKPDGTFHLGKVSSVATLAITLTANVPTGGLSAGAKVWFMGAPADHTEALYNGTTAVTVVIADKVGGVRGTLNKYEPMVIHSDNAANAGTLENCAGVYSPI